MFHLAAIARVFAVLGLAVLLAGCGDDAEKQPAGVEPGAFSLRFEKLTGLRLDASETPTWVRYNSLQGSTSTRLGAFTIYLLKQERGRDVLIAGGGDETPEKGAGGAFYTSTGSGFSAAKEYGENIIVKTQVDDRRPDEEFERLDRAVRAAIADDPNLIAPADRDCAGAGIDPAEGKEGSCRLGEKGVTVVDAGSELEVPVLKAKLVGVTLATELPARNRYDQPEPARGRFVIVKYALENTGDEPITSLRPSLIVDEKTFTESPKAYKLTDYSDSPFPLQPGETQEILTAFDVPDEAATAATERGQLQLPAERYEDGGSLNDRSKVGRIRLAGAPRVSLAGGAAGGISTGGGSTAGSTRKSVRTRDRERAAQQALKKFYTALRSGDIKTICSRLTEAAQQQFGGEAACSAGKRIKPEASARAPESNAKLKFTTILTRQESRATILVRREGGGFTDAARLARQGDLWRVQGSRRLSGRK